MDWSKWISIGISVIALFVSLWGYFVYDRPIKRLQKKELGQKELEKKQAIIKLDYYLESGNSMLRVSNVGLACAYNLKLKGLSKELAFSQNEPIPNTHVINKLRPEDTPQKIGLVYRRAQLIIEATWDDDSATGRTEIFELNCNARS